MENTKILLTKYLLAKIYGHENNPLLLSLHIIIWPSYCAGYSKVSGVVESAVWRERDEDKP